MKDPREVRERVRQDYSRLATPNSVLSCCPVKQPPSLLTGLTGYRQEDLGCLPGAASFPSFGCGNPVAYSDIREGETVVDLGSGAGLDLILAARKVGPSGRVIGIDMTEEMVTRARENVEAAGLESVEVRKGIIEDLPVKSSSADWVISNCVINLSPEKEKVFAEIVRILKPGGKMRISDIVVRDLPDWAKKNQSLHSACIAGAVDEEAYLEGLRSSGLEEVEVGGRRLYDASQLKAFLQLEVTGTEASDPCSCSGFLMGELLGRTAELLEGKVWSALFCACKPQA